MYMEHVMLHIVYYRTLLTVFLAAELQVFQAVDDIKLHIPRITIQLYAQTKLALHVFMLHYFAHYIGRYLSYFLLLLAVR